MDDFISYFNIISLLFFALVVCAAFYKELRFGGAAMPVEGGARRHRLWLLLILLAALALRLWAFGSVPGGFNQDGAMAAVEGKALADYGTDRFGTWLPAHLWAWGYGQMSSLLSYLIAVFVRLFGLNEVTARLPQLLASLMGGLCFYLFVRDGFGRRVGLIAAALLAIDPWHFMQSRWALDCNLLPHFFMAGLYFLQRGLNGRRIWLYVSMVFFGLCMYCYGIAIYTVSLFLLGMGLYLLIKKQLSMAELLGCAGLWLLISWPFILTMAINFFGWETVSLPFVTMQYFPGSIRAGDILFFSEDFGAQLLSNLKSFANVVLLQKKDLDWNDMQGFGTMYLFTLPFAAAGLFALVKTRGSGKRLGLAGLFTGVWAGLVTNGVNINRVNLIFYFMLLLIALGLEFTAAHLPRLKLPALCVFALAGALMAGSYFGTYAVSIRGSFFWGFGEALEAAEESGAAVIYVTADTQYEGSHHVSEILTLFYDRTDAEYFQGKTDENKGEKLLPYRERFVYLSVGEGTADSAVEGAAFVVKASDAPYFPAESYAVRYYGGYACVTGK